MATTTITLNDIDITAGAKYDTVNKDITWTAPSIPSGNTITSMTMTGICTVSSDAVHDVTINGQYLSFTLDDDTEAELQTFNVILDPTSPGSTKCVIYKNAAMVNRHVYFKNVIITVEYVSSSTYYTVNFIDHFKTVLSSQQVQVGTAAVPPAVADNEIYAFIGWDQDYSYIGKDMTIKALCLIMPINKIKTGSNSPVGIYAKGKESVRVYHNSSIIYNKHASYDIKFNNTYISNLYAYKNSKKYKVTCPEILNNYIDNISSVIVHCHLEIKTGLNGRIDTTFEINDTEVETFYFDNKDPNFEHSKTMAVRDYSVNIGTTIPETLKLIANGNGYLYNNSHLALTNIYIEIIFNL